MSVAGTSATKAEHSPTLNTVLMVEEVLREMDESAITQAELKRRLPRQVNHYTLRTILRYLEESNKILTTVDGITWIFNPDPRRASGANPRDR